MSPYPSRNSLHLGSRAHFSLRTKGILLSATAALLFLPCALAFAQQGQMQDLDDEASPLDRIAPRDMIERSGKAIERMRKALKIILAKLQEARDSKDVVKLNCVNDRLTDVKSMLRISEQADVTLQEAVARQDLSKALHALGTVEANSKKIDQLVSESEQCIGLLAFDTTGTKLTVIEPETDFWSDDSNTSSDPAESSNVSRPVTASPVE